MNSFIIYFRKDHSKVEFELHEVYGVDVYISTGDGKSKERDVRTTVYKKSDQTYALKMKASRSKFITICDITYWQFWLFYRFLKIEVRTKKWILGNLFNFRVRINVSRFAIRDAFLKMYEAKF